MFETAETVLHLLGPGVKDEAVFKQLGKAETEHALQKVKLSHMHVVTGYLQRLREQARELVHRSAHVVLEAEPTATRMESNKNVNRLQDVSVWELREVQWWMDAEKDLSFQEALEIVRSSPSS